jgi:hypothetical protein
MRLEREPSPQPTDVHDALPTNPIYVRAGCPACFNSDQGRFLRNPTREASNRRSGAAGGGGGGGGGVGMSRNGWSNNTGDGHAADDISVSAQVSVEVSEAFEAGVQHDLTSLGLLIAEMFLRRPMVITSSRVMLAELTALPMALQPLVRSLVLQQVKHVPRHSLSATVSDAFGGTRTVLGPKTCLYPGPRLASTTKKLRRRNCGAGLRHPTTARRPPQAPVRRRPA